MWHQINDGLVAVKWYQTNDLGRIIARIVFKENEYKASTMVFNDEGVGSSEGLGAYITLEQAKAAVEARGHEIR